MTRRHLQSLAALLSLALFASALADAEDAPIGRGVGGRVADFQLTDAVSGKPISLYGYRGKKAVVLVFLGTECPVGNLYMPRLAELAKDYEPKGVAFVAINANAHESAEDVARHAKEYHLNFPVIKD